MKIKKKKILVGQPSMPPGLNTQLWAHWIQNMHFGFFILKNFPKPVSKQYHHLYSH